VRHALRTLRFAVRFEVGLEVLDEQLLQELTAQSGWTPPVPVVRFAVEPEVLDEELAAGPQGHAFPVSVVHH
jgi:hypothetical protein